MADSPGSPLSSIASEEFMEDMKFDDQGNSPDMPPSKRRRTAFDRHTPVSSIHDDPVPASPSSSISSDSSGELPNSPHPSSLGLDDDYSGQGNDQITVCGWDGCDGGDFENMDNLVKHIEDEHIGTRQKKHSCEWSDCSRKGQTHASGYALRAHIRSHTREKPFYCFLPECDRSFTRSDALAKHMRTVHETEALRPSDPVPKHHPQSGTPGPATTSSGKTPRIKLKLSQPSKDANHNGTDKDADLEDSESIPVPEFGPEMGFDEHELSLPPKQLYRVLRRQIHWAEKETAELKRKWEEVLEPLRKQTWREKEAILDDVINAEIRVVGSGVAAGEEEASAGDALDRMETEEGKSDPMPQVKEQSGGPLDDESAPAENDVSMMDVDVEAPTPDVLVDTKPPAGLEVEPQPG